MRRVHVVVLAGVLVVAAACSSGSDDDSTARATTAPTTSTEPSTDTVPSLLPEQLDHPAYVARLNEICTSAEQGGDLGPSVDASSTVNDVDAAVDAVETRYELMREMEVPDADQSAWADVERAYDRYLTALTELSDARSADDRAESEQVVVGLDALRLDVANAVEALGAVSCGL